MLEAGGEVVEKSRINRAGDEASGEGFVWAAGRSAQKGSDWIGLKAHFRGFEGESALEMHAGRGVYVGISGIEGGWSNVCALIRNRGAEKVRGAGAALLIGHLRASGLVQLAERLSAAEYRDGSFTGVSALCFGRQFHPEKLCAIGDAEWMIPPFTGNGMTMAFESAECVVELLVDFAKGKSRWETVREEVHRRLEKKFRSRMRAASCLHPFLYTSSGQLALSVLSKNAPVAVQSALSRAALTPVPLPTSTYIFLFRVPSLHR